MSTLGVAILKDELREWISKHQRLLCLLEEIYPHAENPPAMLEDPAPPPEPAPIPPGNGLPKPTQPISTRINATRSISGRGGHNAKERSADGKSKKCHGCGKMFELDKFAKNHTCKDGHEGTCRKCKKERVQKRNREKLGRVGEDPGEVQTITVPAINPAIVTEGFKCECGKQFRTRFVFQEHKERCTAI